MRKEPEDSSAIETQMLKFEMIEGLQRAIDRNYRRLLKAARADWKRLFGGKDPSDVCVSVRTTVAKTKREEHGLRGSGFLKSRRQPVSKSGDKSSLPRFAQ